MTVEIKFDSWDDFDKNIGGLAGIITAMGQANLAAQMAAREDSPPKCECGNTIRYANADGTYPAQCEWCENPETPFYKINVYGETTELRFLGMVGEGVEVRYSDTLTAVAPSEASAQLILDDYIAQDVYSEKLIQEKEGN